MRRIVLLVISASLAVGLLGALAGPAGAQTGDLAAFCAARLEANDVEGKAANLAVMNKILGVAPAAVVQPMTALRDAYQKKGDKLFDSAEGLQLLGALDGWIYDNCPGQQVPVTAIDYEYQGMPATLKPGVAQFKMTNGAPKEDHMLAIMKLTPEGQGQDVEKLLAMPQKKSTKYFDASSRAFMFAPAGAVGYSPIDLQPGTYVYACFLPQGGKKNGQPHFMLGMNGSLTVS